MLFCRGFSKLVDQIQHPSPEGLFDWEFHLHRNLMIWWSLFLKKVFFHAIIWNSQAILHTQMLNALKHILCAFIVIEKVQNHLIIKATYCYCFYIIFKKKEQTSYDGFQFVYLFRFHCFKDYCNEQSVSV